MEGAQAVPPQLLERLAKETQQVGGTTTELCSSAEHFLPPPCGREVGCRLPSRSIWLWRGGSLSS
jgi:hypothetical protein